MRVRVEENFRREPQGQVLGRIGAGARLDVVERSGGWTRATLEGWVWTASLQTTTREGFDLVVSASGGENLRAEPSGSIRARLEEGTLLEELERRPGWTRVRRVAWIWTDSVETLAAGSGGRPAAGAGTTPAPPTEASPAAPPSFLSLRSGSAVLAAPGADTLVRTTTAVDAQVVAREGSWVRVRIEGWAWAPDTPSAEAEAPSAEEVTPALLAAEDGSRHVGRGVTWPVQYISLERAEAVRTDFFEGEPFLLARYGGADGPFVYVAVPTDRVSEVEGLTPLEQVVVTGRVRAASAALTGAPIIDLLTIRRGPGG